MTESTRNPNSQRDQYTPSASPNGQTALDEPLALEAVAERALHRFSDRIS